jgi:hypothetical protein
MDFEVNCGNRAGSEVIPVIEGCGERVWLLCKLDYDAHTIQHQLAVFGSPELLIAYCIYF